MSKIYDMQGITWSGLGIDNTRLKVIELPEGWEKQVRDVSTLTGNSGVKTKSVATLKEFEPVVLTCLYDPADSLTLTNGQCVITFPSSGGTITFWGQISAVGKPSNVEVDGLPEQEITITLTNLNDSGVETAPVYAAA